MDPKGLLMSDNRFDIDRGMYGVPSNPFLGYNNHHIRNQHSIPYQFPAATESLYAINGGAGTFDQAGYGEPSRGYGMKNSNLGYGNMGAGSHYVTSVNGKTGKLKGAALSALTLLAFLFFLNLLQSCLKDQLDAMNPTVRIIHNKKFFNKKYNFR